MSVDWQRQNLGDLCEVITKGASPKWQGFNYLESPGVLFVRSENVGENEMLFHNKTKYVDPAFNNKHKRSILRRGDVLTNLVGSIGRTAIYDRDDLANINQAVGILRCIPELINNRFLSYLLNSSAFRATFFSSAVDSRSNLSLTFFKNLEVLIPPLPEQKRIVSILDEAFGAIERAKEIAETNLANARELFESYLNRVFTEKGKGWEEKTLGEISDLISGQHINTKDYNTDGRGMSYLTGPSDFGRTQPTITKWTEHPKRTAVRGDVLITVKGSGVGKANIASDQETCISRQLMAIRSKDLQPDFLFAFLQTKFDYFQQLATGAAIPGISREDVLGLRIAHPKDEQEQKIIVASIRKAKSAFRNLDATYTQKLDNLDELKQSILQKAFTGQLTAKSPELEAVP